MSQRERSHLNRPLDARDLRGPPLSQGPFRLGDGIELSGWNFQRIDFHQANQRLEATCKG